MFGDEVVWSGGIVKMVEVIDERGEWGGDVVLDEGFGYGFGVGGRGWWIEKEIGEGVIICDNCGVGRVKGEEGFWGVWGLCGWFERKRKK